MKEKPFVVAFMLLFIVVMLIVLLSGNSSEPQEKSFDEITDYSIKTFTDNYVNKTHGITFEIPEGMIIEVPRLAADIFASVHPADTYSPGSYAEVVPILISFYQNSYAEDVESLDAKLKTEPISREGPFGTYTGLHVYEDDIMDDFGAPYNGTYMLNVNGRSLLISYQSSLNTEEHDFKEIAEQILNSLDFVIAEPETIYN